MDNCNDGFGLLWVPENRSDVSRKESEWRGGRHQFSRKHVVHRRVLITASPDCASLLVEVMTQRACRHSQIVQQVFVESGGRFECFLLV